LVEFALVFPMFMLVLVGVIVLGVLVFYQQQLTNAAREAARFAAIHSATAACPTVGTLDPDGIDPETGATGNTAAFLPLSYSRCDEQADGWPAMSAFARSKVFGVNAGAILFTACWSGYRDVVDGNPTGTFDMPPPNTYTISGVDITVDSEFVQCTIDGVDATDDPGPIPCSSGLFTDDTASSTSEGGGRITANRVTVFACYEWSPPMAGFLLIPATVTMQAVISEPIERQQ
jgi:hypothetical protein